MSDIHFFADAAAMRRWLEEHAVTAAELHVGYHKVGTGRAGLTWSASVDEALCFGWIDGVRRRIDDDSYTIRFTPRKPGSTWSVVNIDKVAQLRAQGRMTPAGERAFAARLPERSGIYSHEQSDAPALTDAQTQRFREDDAAWTYFESCPPGYRKRMLHWVTSARRPATREGRLAQLIAACAAGRRLA